MQTDITLEFWIGIASFALIVFLVIFRSGKTYKPAEYFTFMNQRGHVIENNAKNIRHFFRKEAIEYAGKHPYFRIKSSEEQYWEMARDYFKNEIKLTEHGTNNDKKL